MKRPRIWKLALIAAFCGVAVLIGFHFSPHMSARRHALTIFGKRDWLPEISAPDGSRMISLLSRALVHLSNQKYGRNAIDSPKFLFRAWFDVDSISLEFATDEDLGLLTAFPECRKLRLNFGQYTDKGLSHLRAMKNLRELEISCEDITDEGLANLHGLDHLEFLEIQFGQINGIGFREMTCHESLRELHISFSDIFDDEGMLEVAVFRNLKRLDVIDCSVKGPGLVVTEKLPSLRFLSGFSSKNVDPEWIPFIRRVPNRY